MNNQDKINRIISSVRVPVNHPLFYPRIFALATKALKQKGESNLSIESVFTNEYDELSRRLDRAQIQDSTSVRNLLRVRKLVEIIINEKGEINSAILVKAIEALREHLYSLGPQRQYEAKRNEHLLTVLLALHSNKEVFRLLKNISKPFSNKYAEDLIRETLLLPHNIPITDAHTKKAVLAAWLSYLRQNVGSCFATAPAEIVHDEQPELFLHDIIDLLGTGRLKRVFEGIEYTVPISSSWGNGDLKKPLIIRKLSKGIFPEIWFSPGLIKAFEATGLLDPDDLLKNTITKLKSWLEPIFQEAFKHQNYLIINSEQLIRIILLKFYDLTEQQLQEYENRPRPMVQGQLMLQPIHATKSLGGVSEKCVNFLYQFELAKQAFKSLTDNALLKAWEFTLASFSETKFEFTQWNLYASLGMATNDPGGIGESIYQVIQQKIDVLNKKVQDMQYEYEMVYTQVKILESRVRHSSEQEIQWLKPEYQSRTQELYSLEEQRTDAQYRAQNLVHMYESLYKLYLELFKDYFQEVYDADMQEVITGPFDDSPAGFRLVYKHGRSNTSQWTRIKNHNEFIDALASFFAVTEPQVATLLEEKGMQKDLSDVVTAIITRVKTNEFLESAFYRMAIAHKTTPIKDPLDHLEHIEKKPWVYTSGGTMNTLTMCYFRLPGKPTEVAKWVENEMELLVFLAETVNRIQHPFLNPYLKGERTSMLMQSPTHAFLLKPNLNPFKLTWASEEFTYTFIRDRFVKPTEHFIESILLDEEKMAFLIEKLTDKVPENFQFRFKSVFNHLQGPLNPIFFRDYVVSTMEHDRGLSSRGQTVLAEEEIDSYLFSQLPLFSVDELRERVGNILKCLTGITEQMREEILLLFDRFSLTRSSPLLGSKDLQDIVKAFLTLYKLQTSTSFDYHLLISRAAQKLGYALPAPIIFADTNWAKDEFGFVVNPGTGRLELWRVDYTGTVGAPMSEWKQWVNGSRPDQKWGVYVKPPEYGQN